ncbi:THAP domain-containing protein 1-like isoform X2 [Trichoplusia ni]|uniref:THAP domain-containing protein 1-like isoform X2 n=1 Tax=Trichoplusia ni TaxID=7111 RepID=A0A7E5WYI1_TRINI|nr:THAP domain-containing protein 1-like isoform X2 [Trichoplusia ni]
MICQDLILFLWILLCHFGIIIENYFVHSCVLYRFPSAPERKTKWIEATGRGDNWFPQTYSVICSRHFTEDNFLAIKDRRRLMDSAVPTIYLPVLNPNPSPSPSAKIPQPNVAVKEEILEEPQKQSKRIPPLPTSPSEYESPTEKRLCRRIMELTNSVRLKNIKLKKYRDSNRRLKRIVQSLKSRIAEMEKSD